MDIKPTTDIAAYAWRKLDLLTRIEGKPVPLTVVIRTPFECEDEHWLCAVSLAGLTHRKRDVRGASSEESLAKAKAFAVAELRRHIEQGGVIETVDQQPISSLSSVFS